MTSAAERFRAQHAKGVFPGGQLVVMRRGEVLVDEAVGLARGYRKDEGPAVPYEKATLGFSAGKPLVALAVALLEDGGKLDVAAPVATWWKEFAGAGKGDITVLDVLTHRSGLFMPSSLAMLASWGPACYRRSR